jgi:hypothetical protein
VVAHDALTGLDSGGVGRDRAHRGAGVAGGIDTNELGIPVEGDLVEDGSGDGLISSFPPGAWVSVKVVPLTYGPNRRFETVSRTWILTSGSTVRVPIYCAVKLTALVATLPATSVTVIVSCRVRPFTTL